jgi:[ribosomal protein S5]-alanine N-acetyltransferase
MLLREEHADVAIIAASIESLEAEELGGDAVAAVLGVMAPATWPPDYNDANTRAWMRDMLRQHSGEPGYGSWYIIGGGRLAGIAGYKGPPDADGEVEIGYSVIESERRKGYAKGAVTLLVTRAFRDRRVAAVIAETIPALAGSQAVLDRCGFKLASRTADAELGEILRYRLERP